MKVHIYDPNKSIPADDVAVRLVADEDQGTVSIETVDKNHCGYWILTLSEDGIRRTSCVSTRLGFPCDERKAVKDLEFPCDERKAGNMDCKKIIKEYLVAHHYGGLVDDGCACGLDDLMPCNGNGRVLECAPGYEIEGCTCGENHDSHIVPDRRKAARRVEIRGVYGRRIDDRRKQ